MPTRHAMWDRLEGTFDLLIVGGGITGSGIARDAARRGLSVALLDMNDLAFGTSSRSSKLIHGGLRYLEHYEFSLVFESVSERRILQDIAPHLVNPMGFLFPVYGGQKRQLWLINAGMWLYDGLSLFRSPKIHKNLKPKEVAQLEPKLKSDGLKGAPLYYDCATDDARLTLETALDAVEAGAVVVPWAKVTSFVKDERGRIRGVVAEDQLGGKLKKVEARAVVNATGPWTDKTISMSQSRPSSDLLRPTKGVHIVVEREKLPLDHAVVCFHPTDERVLFAIPWGERTYIGTTDTDYEGEPGQVAATAADIEYLLAASNEHFPTCLLTPADVISTWAGIRPLIAPPNTDGDMNESSVSREHQILVGADGLITIAGGKLTTYRRMAREVVDTAARMLEMLEGPLDLAAARTDRIPLPGGVSWPEDDDHEKVAEQVHAAGASHIDMETARYLANTYGMRGVEIAARCQQNPELGQKFWPGRPEIMAQVDWAIEEEFAATVCDFMIRRTQIFFREHDQGLGALQPIADRMGALLGWTEEIKVREMSRYRDEVALSRQWKAGMVEENGAVKDTESATQP